MRRYMTRVQRDHRSQIVKSLAKKKGYSRLTPTECFLFRVECNNHVSQIETSMLLICIDCCQFFSRFYNVLLSTCFMGTIILRHPKPRVLHIHDHAYLVTLFIDPNTAHNLQHNHLISFCIQHLNCVRHIPLL